MQKTRGKTTHAEQGGSPLKRRTSKEVFGEALLTLSKTESLDHITVKQIVEESGLSLQTFYNHFRDKDDVILWLHRRGGERLLARLEGKRWTFHDLTMESIRFCMENSSFLRCSFKGSVQDPYAVIASESAYGFLASFICKRLNREELPEDLAFYLRMYIYACLHVFKEYSVKGWALPREQLAEYLEQGMPEKLKPWLLT